MEVEEPEPSPQDSGTQRSKVCAVCGGESQTYHLNFGVGTCNSCRAFFRRSVQVRFLLNIEGWGRPILPFVNTICSLFQSGNFVLNSPGELLGSKCKGSGECSVAFGTRKRCRWCRFSTCIAAGMDPNRVLPEEQKRQEHRTSTRIGVEKCDNG